MDLAFRLTNDSCRPGTDDYRVPFLRAGPLGKHASDQVKCEEEAGENVHLEDDTRTTNAESVRAICEKRKRSPLDTEYLPRIA